MLRTITSLRPKPMIWRDQHSYMVADNIEHLPSSATGAALSDSSSAQNLGVLKVTGHIRGASLSANRLVYLQNFGAFRIQKITATAVTLHGGDGSCSSNDDLVVLQVPNPVVQVREVVCFFLFEKSWHFNSLFCITNTGLSRL